MTNRISRRAIACALLATTSLSLPTVAHAAAPAPKYLDGIDDHGVDLVTGLPFLAVEEGGIGSGPGRVSMQRIWAEAAGWTDNWTGGMFKSGSLFYVQIQGLSDTFAYAAGDGPYTNTKGTGATLVRIASGPDMGKYLYTSAQGTQVEFDPVADLPSSCPGADSGTCAVPISIVQPNGLEFALDWQEVGSSVRLLSVCSSAGYRLGIDYVSDVVGPDWSKRSRVRFGTTCVSPVPTVSEIDYVYGTNTVEVTDPAGRKWLFTTNATGQLTGVRRPGNTADNINYSYTSGLVGSATKDGVEKTYARSVVGTTGTMTVTDPLSKTNVIVSDLNLGRPTSFSDALTPPRTTGYQYDTSGRLTKVTAPEGNYVQYAYDARGNVTTRTQVAKPGTGLPSIVTSATYDSICTYAVKCNKPNSTTDARGKTTDYTYNTAHGGLLTATQPDPGTGVRPQTRYSYTAVTSATGDSVTMLHEISACQTSASCIGTADEARTVIDYNGSLLLTQVKGTNGVATLATTTLDHDARGNVISVDGPLSGTADTTAYKYDAADQLTGIISPDPDGAGPLPNRAIRISYRDDGQVINRELGTTAGQDDTAFANMTVLQNVDTFYDANSRPNLSRWRGFNGTNLVRQMQTQWSYDSLGRLDCTATRMDATQFTADVSLGACTLGANTNPKDRISKLVYDDAGEVIQVKQAVGTADEAIERTLTYTNNGLVQTLKDAENNKTTYVYDGHDRLSQTQFPTASPKGAGTSDPANYEQLTYENTQSGTRTSGTVASFRNRAGQSIAFGYDGLTQLTSKDLPGTEPDVTYAYDNLGRLTSASQTGNALSFGWDALSRNISEGGPHGTTSFAYDAASRRTGITYSTSGGGSALTVNYGYLTTGELISITQGANTLASYGYDSLGNRLSVAFGNGVSQVYTYDSISRLASITNNLSGTANDLTVTITGYNPASQIIGVTRSNDAYAFTGHANQTTAYTQNGLNQMTAAGASAIGWTDARGNLTSDGTSGKGYGYSSENLLTSSTGGTAATLAYDPALRLYEVAAGSATTRFAYDGVDAIAEYNGSSNLLRRYVYDDAGRPVVQYEGTGTASPRYLSSDERGSVIAQTDGSGALLGIDSYDEYGRPGTANIGRFQYTGQKWLSEIGAYDYKARVYLPHLGVFAQSDAIGYDAGANLYAYVGNDPVNLIDPLGLCVSSVGGGKEIVITKCRPVNPAPGPNGGNGGRADRIYGGQDTVGDRKDNGDDEDKKKKEFCDNLSKRTKQLFDEWKDRDPFADFARNFAWDNAAQLNSDLRFAQSDLRDLQGLQSFAENFSGGTLIGGMLFPRAAKALHGIIGGPFLGALSLTGWAASKNLSARIADQQAKIAALKIRLDQLHLQQAGVCQ